MAYPHVAGSLALCLLADPRRGRQSRVQPISSSEASEVAPSGSMPLRVDEP